MQEMIQIQIINLLSIQTLMSHLLPSFPDLRIVDILTGQPTLLLSNRAFTTLSHTQIIYIILNDIQTHSLPQPIPFHALRKSTSISHANSTISNSKDTATGPGCSCRKSKCLKLYCQCFSEGGYCREGCTCEGCQNRIQFKIQRSEAVIAALEREPNAFGQKKQSLKERQKGCTCKKSGCRKKYCECYARGFRCTNFCKCQGCQNCYKEEEPKVQKNDTRCLV